MATFRSVHPQAITDNPFKLIGEDWGLVTAGDAGAVNMMTVSWGGVGIMWNKPVAFTFIRPQRYTFPLLEQHDGFSICFFDETYRDQLRFCGTHSGRTVNKTAETGLTTAFTESGVPYFEEARLVLVCKKLYGQFLNAESMIDSETVSRHYNDDWHKMYISEITDVLLRQ